jgi:hypothetical protein
VGTLARFFAFGEAAAAIGFFMSAPMRTRICGTGSRKSAVGRSYLPRNSCGPSDPEWF